MESFTLHGPYFLRLPSASVIVEASHPFVSPTIKKATRIWSVLLKGALWIS